MRICALVLGILFVAGISFAADVDGRWSGEIKQIQFGGFGGGQAQPTVLTFEFKADGEKLTGYSIPAGMQIQVPIREGIVKGKKIWFLVDANMFGQEMTYRYKGTVSGDKIKLSYRSVNKNKNIRYMGETKVTLKRQ